VDYGIRWEPACIKDIEEIFGDLESADDAIHAMEWQLSHDPFTGTWELSPNSEILIARTRAHRGFPPVAYSFTVVIEPGDCYCLMLRARPTNIPGLS
jgi:hypothetical protein